MDSVGHELVDESRPLPSGSSANAPRAAFAPTAHHSALAAADPYSALYQEWNTYRQQVAALLAAGHAGRHALIKGDTIAGIWDSHQEALTAGYQRFGDEPFLVHQIQERERILRRGTRQRCRN